MFSVNNESPYRFVVDDSTEYVVLADIGVVSRYYKLPVGKHRFRLFVEDKGLPSNNKQTEVMYFEVFEDRVTTLRASRPGVIGNVNVQVVYKPLPPIPIRFEQLPSEKSEPVQKPEGPYGTVRLTVKKAAGLGLMAYADGCAYKFIFDDEQPQKIVISSKRDVTEEIQLPYGDHTVYVRIYGWNDPRCEKGSTTKSAKFTFTVDERVTAVLADRPSSFASNCPLEVKKIGNA